MIGRITSRWPALNEYGVPYSELLVRERSHHARLLALYRDALEAWLQVDQAPRNATRKALA